MIEETKIGGDSYRFKETAWTNILKGNNKTALECHRSLAYLISTYWKPIYFYVRRKGYDRESAKDLTQSFFTVFLEKDYLKSVEPAKGKFRTFLLASLNHFLSKEIERGRAKKRGAGQIILSPDDFARAENEISPQPIDKVTPEKIFTQTWVRTILNNATEYLSQEFLPKFGQAYFDIIEAYLASQQEIQSITYKEIAQKFNLLESDVTNHLHNIRKRYRELVENEIRKYVTSENEVKEEVKELFTAFI